MPMMKNARLVGAALAAAFVVTLFLGGCAARTAAPSASVDIDYSNKTGTGYPLVFGGCADNNNDANSVSTLYSAGFTMARRDMHLEAILPKTTVADYKNNVNNVQDPSTWNWSACGNLLAYYNKGYKIMLVICYCPTWLSASGTPYGVPSDWSVYEDIVKKAYQRYQGKISFLEVWNEPNLPQFLTKDGSSEPDTLTAYRDIYFHVCNAVRSVDQNVPIGGPVQYNISPTDDLMGAMLSDTRISGNIDFVSYHDYGTGYGETVTDWKKYLADHGKQNIPIFCTEWNYNALNSSDPMNSMDSGNISYCGTRLMDFYKLGAYGTCLFGMARYEEYQSDYLEKNRAYAAKVGVWRLMSGKLKLGEGNGTVVSADYDGVQDAMGAINKDGEKVTVLANDSLVPVVTIVMLDNTGLSGKATVEVYEASAKNDASRPSKTINVTVTSGATRVTVAIPARSVVGLRLLAK